MVKEEIVEGLKVALSKGESLQKAMMSFYNAGYQREDIIEAAKYLQYPSSLKSKKQQTPKQAQPPQTKNTSPTLTPMQKISPTLKIDISKTSSPPTTNQIQRSPLYLPSERTISLKVEQPGVIQKYSYYGEMPSKKGTIITTILIVILIVLLGVLVATFLFKNEIIEFLNRVIKL